MMGEKAKPLPPRYTELAHDFANIQENTTPFSPALSRLTVDSQTLPAVVMRRSLLAELPAAQKQYYCWAIGDILGLPNWQQELQETKFSAESTVAGWGHGFEAQVMADATALLTGRPVVRLTAEELVGQFGRPYQIKELAHKAVQHGQDVRDEMTKAGFVHGVTKDRLCALLASLALNLAGLDGKNTDTSLLDRLTQAHFIHKRTLGLAYFLNWLVFDRDMVKALDIFRRCMGITAGYTANPATTRSKRGADPESHDGIINHIVDVGYCRKPSGELVPSQLLEFVNAGPIAVPDSTTAEVLAQYFGHFNSFRVGENVGQIVDARQVLPKWFNTKDRRIVLGSTSGNGASIKELKEMLADFIAYHQIHPKSPYTCIFFTGEHGDSGVNPQMANFIQEVRLGNAVEITASWNTPLAEIQNQVLSHQGELILVRTEDIQLTAIVKLWLQQIAHVEVVKPGEAHFMNPSVATVSYLLTPAPPNEPFNGTMALLKGGSIARSEKWPDHIRRYFKYLSYPDDQIDEILKTIPGISPQPGNIFEALDKFWGDTLLGREVGVNVIKKQALRGFVEVDNATIPLVAMEVANASGKSLAQEKYAAFVRDNIAAYLTQEKANKKNLIYALFPDDF
jgi:hypothetical protein